VHLSLRARSREAIRPVGVRLHHLTTEAESNAGEWDERV
jgi:hypothetical protein